MSESGSIPLALDYASSRPIRTAEFRNDGQTLSIIIPAPAAWRVLLPPVAAVIITVLPLTILVALIAMAVLAPGKARVVVTSDAAVFFLIALFGWFSLLAIVRLARATRLARLPMMIVATADELLVYQPQAMNDFETWERRNLIAVAARTQPSLLGGWKLVLAIAAHSEPGEVALIEKLDSSARFEIATREPELAPRIEAAILGRLKLSCSDEGR
jgi:hypothetical protein